MDPTGATAFDCERPRKKKRRDFETSPNPTSAAHHAELPCNANKMLKSFAERDETLRAITTCKICFRPLFEPFTAQCGHTYCYSCLCQWFGNSNRARKTCPDCRAAINVAPAPAYALREVTRELFQRPELFAAEDLSGYEELQREEAAAVERDRSNKDPNTGGLFGGYFRNTSPELRSGPLRDVEDGVDRCPLCAWELEGQHCNNCGYEFHSDREGTYSSEGTAEYSNEMPTAIDTEDELDGDISLEDHDFNESMGPYADDDEHTFSSGSDSFQAQNVRGQPRFQLSRRGAELVHLDSESDGESAISNNNPREYPDGSQGEESSEEDEEGESSSMHDFVVDDDAVIEEYRDGSETSNSTTRQARTYPVRRPRYTIIESDDEEPSDSSEASRNVGSGNIRLGDRSPSERESGYSSSASQSPTPAQLTYALDSGDSG